ncbi:MAG: DNA repair protein, partial [Rhodospirillales bacterium CG15_BIG_FIL_POST_REV_8_21_14_020_66_15]
MVSVWFPRFATDRLAAGRNSPAETGASPPPLATLIQARGGWRLAAVDARAARVGLVPGLPLADARAQVPMLDTAAADPAADARTLEGLARWAGRYTPWTAVDGTAPEDAGIPGVGLWLDVTGCAHLFGSEEAMLADLVRRLNAAGYAARAGLATTPGAAWALARFAADGGQPWKALAAGQEKSALVDLPVAALRLACDTAETMVRLGLRRVGDLYPLARAALALRFGLEPCLRLDQALGMRDEPLSP